MAKIRVLPENLSNKIAAGEVVERPASVVKELVENALDAGATRVIIEVEKGGQSLIQVSDNGAGMRRDDALLAIERYATSKISTDDDLFAISTLGFRGEALPSIAAVSRFALLTRHNTSDAGTQISVDGGKIKNVSEIGAPQGTMITVKQLFFNIPARKKFLKSVGTEMSHIADIVTRMALGHPEVQFRLIHNNKAFGFRLDLFAPDCAPDFKGAIYFCQRSICSRPQHPARRISGVCPTPGERAISDRRCFYQNSFRSGGCQRPSDQK
jgi:DNA mismatch repair protein MutL